jgi:hypothetical protein
MCPLTLRKKALHVDSGVAGGYSVTVGGDNYSLFGHPISQINNILSIQDANPYLAISMFSFSHSNKLELTLSVNPQHFSSRDALMLFTNQYFPEELKLLCDLSGV